MQTIPITVQIPLDDLTPEDIRAAVIAEVADRVLGRRNITRQEEDGEEYTVPDYTILHEMRVDAQKEVSAAIKTVVDTQVPAEVERVLSGTFTPMTTWGDRAGPPTTIREMIGGHAKRWLEEMVDRRDGQVRGYSDNGKVARLHYLIAKEVDAAFDATLKAEVAKVGTEIKTLMAGKINAAIAEVVNRIVKQP